MSVDLVRNELTRIFEEKGLQWFFLRRDEDIQTPPNAPNDLDIWLARDDYRTAVRALVAKGYLPIGGRLSWDANGHSRSHVLRCEHSDESNLVIELWCGNLRAGPFDYIDEHAIESSDRYNASVPVPTDGLYLVILINRLLLANRLDRLRQRRAKAFFLGCGPEGVDRWRQITDATLGNVTRIRLEEWIAGTGALPSRVEVLRRYFLMRPKSLIGVCKTLVSALRDKAAPYIRGKGRSIAFVGTDGAGKSTLASYAMSYLDSIGYTASLCYMGRSRGQTRIVSLMRRLILQHKQSSTSDGTREAIDFSWRTNVGAVVYCIDYWIRFLCYIRPRQIAGIWTFIDRGPADLIVMKADRQFRRLAYYSPQPSASVFCFADAQTILTRKQERGSAEIMWQQREYRSYFNQMGNRIPILFLNTAASSKFELDSRVLALIHLELGRGLGNICSTLCKETAYMIGD